MATPPPGKKPTRVLDRSTSAGGWNPAGAGRRRSMRAAQRLTMTPWAMARGGRHWRLVSAALARLGAGCNGATCACEQTLFGCRFANPVGAGGRLRRIAVAAGVGILFGFGFARLGLRFIWHAPTGKNRDHACSAGGRSAPPLNRMGFNTNARRAGERTWSVRT